MFESLITDEQYRDIVDTLCNCNGIGYTMWVNSDTKELKLVAEYEQVGSENWHLVERIFGNGDDWTTLAGGDPNITADIEQAVEYYTGDGETATRYDLLDKITDALDNVGE